jgi:undecaprenyl-diphosphatase
MMVSMRSTSIWARLRDREWWVLITLFLTGAALWGFIELADEVREGDARAFDRMILLALRDPSNAAAPVGPRWVQEAARDITSLGGTIVLALVTIAATGFLALVRKRRAALFVIAAVVGGGVLCVLLKAGFDRPRPDLVPHPVPVYSSSFPSGHAMLATVTYLTLGALLAEVQPRKRVKAYLLGWAVTLSVLIGASRIYLGVHWPTDVLAGWCVGSAWALLCASVALWLQRRGAIELHTQD